MHSARASPTLSAAISIYAMHSARAAPTLSAAISICKRCSNSQLSPCPDASSSHQSLRIVFNTSYKISPLKLWSSAQIQDSEDLTSSRTLNDVRVFVTSRESAVAIATRYGLDGPGNESRWGVRFSASVQTGTRVFPGGKVAGAWRCPPIPSSAEVKERLEIYLYSPMGLRGLF
jgi:hypothetical protein